MAIIKCVECGREISDKAAACIHCGCPISFSKQAYTASAETRAGSGAANADVSELVTQIFGAANQNAVPTVSVEAKLTGPLTASTVVGVYVPEFNKTVRVSIPNSITEGRTLMISAGINAAANGINSPLKVHVAKVIRDDAAKTAPTQPPVLQDTQAAARRNSIDTAAKTKELKRRVYTKPVIRFVLSLCFVFSFVGMALLMYLFPEGGAPDFVMNIVGIGFFLGFFSVFCFKFFPYIIGRYPDPGFIKTRRIMKHLEKRGLLEKAVIEMETCRSVPFGDKMCLSDSFLFPKKKNGIIIPCDELLWVYANFSNRRGCGYLMLGTKNWGINCFSHITGRKQYTQAAAAAIQALQKRNPSVLVGESKENQKKYFSLTKK